MKNLKEICRKLDSEYCYFRNPKSRFIKVLGQDIVNELVEKGYLKDSPKIENIRDFDEPCYEFSKKFRFISNFYTNSFWVFVKYYIIYDTIQTIKEHFRH